MKSVNSTTEEAEFIIHKQALSSSTEYKSPSAAGDGAETSARHSNAPSNSDLQLFPTTERKTARIAAKEDD